MIGRFSTASGYLALGLLALTLPDDEQAQRLGALAVTILAPPTDRPWGERTLHVEDPDGNVVELTRAKDHG